MLGTTPVPHCAHCFGSHGLRYTLAIGEAIEEGIITCNTALIVAQETSSILKAQTTEILYVRFIQAATLVNGKLSI